MTPAEAPAPLPPDIALRTAGRARVTREQIDDLVRPAARPGARDAAPSTARGGAAPPWSPETRRRLLESLRGSKPTR